MKPLKEFLLEWWDKRTGRERFMVAFALGEITTLTLVFATMQGWLGGPL